MMTSTNQPAYKKQHQSLVSATIISLLALSGCQTTTGIQSPQSNPPIYQPNVYEPDPLPAVTSPASRKEVNDHTGSLPTQTAPSSTVNKNQIERPTPQHHPDYTGITAPDTTAPSYENNAPPEADSRKNKPAIDSSNDVYIITPPEEDTTTARQMLLERARQNSQKAATAKPTIQNGDNIPAFRRLMNSGVQHLKAGDLSSAQSTFTRAQRLAPHSSAVYFYLGQVALKQQQALKAEAMARRGLVVAQSASRKKGLWQLILKSAQMQGNQKVIEEAMANLK